MVKIEKKVEFNLNTESESGEVSLPDLRDKGHSRNHIILLFQKLEEEGFGEFRPGARGRGMCALFLKNEKCPENYTLVIEEKPRGRHRKVVAESVVENDPNLDLDALANEINNGTLVVDDSLEDSGEEDAPKMVSIGDLSKLISDMSVEPNDEVDGLASEIDTDEINASDLL